MKNRLLILTAIVLLVGLGFVATQIIFTYDTALSRVATSSSMTKKSQTLTGDFARMLARIPANDTVVAAERLQNDAVLAVSVIPTSGGTPNIRIWFIPSSNAKPVLLKEHSYSSTPKVEFAWSQDLPRVEVSLVGLTEMFSVSTHDYIDTENSKWLAGTEGPQFSDLSIETPAGTLHFEPKFTHLCSGVTDTATALIMDGVEIPLKKTVRTSCQLFCEGGCVYGPPDMGYASFDTDNSDSLFDHADMVSFNLPWGTPVEFDLSSPTSTIHSKDFAKEYPFR